MAEYLATESAVREIHVEKVRARTWKVVQVPAKIVENRLLEVLRVEKHPKEIPSEGRASLDVALQVQRTQQKRA